MFSLHIQARLYRTGHDLRLIVNNGPTGNEAGVADKALLKLVARGRRWYEQLTTGQRSSLREIAQAEKLDERYMSRILYGSLLAPDIIEKVLRGQQSVAGEIAEAAPTAGLGRTAASLRHAALSEASFLN